MYSKNIFALGQVMPSHVKSRTKIFTNTYLATSANYKSHYTASFYARKHTSITRRLEQLA